MVVVQSFDWQGRKWTVIFTNHFSFLIFFSHFFSVVNISHEITALIKNLFSKGWREHQKPRGKPLFRPRQPFWCTLVTNLGFWVSCIRNDLFLMECSIKNTAMRNIRPLHVNFGAVKSFLGCRGKYLFGRGQSILGFNIGFNIGLNIQFNIESKYCRGGDAPTM